MAHDKVRETGRVAVQFDGVARVLQGVAHLGKRAAAGISQDLLFLELIQDTWFHVPLHLFQGGAYKGKLTENVCGCFTEGDFTTQ